MGLLESLLGALLRVLCGPPAPQAPPDGASQDVYVPPTIPHKPAAGQQQQQRPPVSTPPSYHSRPEAHAPARPHQGHSPSPARVVRPSLSF